MMLSEFEQLTGIYPDSTTYRIIEEEYYLYEGDKKAFCKAYQNNTDNLAVRIRDKVNDFHSKLIDTYTTQITDLKSSLESLGQKLEREEEWKPFGTLSKMPSEEYEKLQKACKEEFGEEQLRRIIEQECNFDYEKVKIIHAINSYEVNRHKQFRKIGEEARKPMYFASDWNYIRFNSGHYQYEYINGTLRFFED